MSCDPAVALGRVAAIQQDRHPARGHGPEERRREARVVPSQDGDRPLEPFGGRRHRAGDADDLRPELGVGQGDGVVLHRQPMGESFGHVQEPVQHRSLQRRLRHGFEGLGPVLARTAGCERQDFRRLRGSLRGPEGVPRRGLGRRRQVFQERGEAAPVDQLGYRPVAGVTLHRRELNPRSPRHVLGMDPVVPGLLAIDQQRARRSGGRQIELAQIQLGVGKGLLQGERGGGTVQVHIKARLQVGRAAEADHLLGPDPQAIEHGAIAAAGVAQAQHPLGPERAGEAVQLRGRALL